MTQRQRIKGLERKRTSSDQSIKGVGISRKWLGKFAKMWIAGIIFWGLFNIGVRIFEKLGG